MLGAIAGDIIGSVFEANSIKTTEFQLFSDQSRFTDDSVLTCAVADWLIQKEDLVKILKKYTRKFPRAGYGENYFQWAMSGSREPYNSWGNGSAMRVSPVSFAFDNLDQVMEYAKKSAEVTHSHPEGIKGAQATACSGFLAKEGRSKHEIRNFVEKSFGYNLSLPTSEVRKDYSFRVSCQESVPQAIRAFIDSENYENAIRLAISLGGDADTQAAIAGGIAEAFYGPIPEPIAKKAKSRLPEELLAVVEDFYQTFVSH